MQEFPPSESRALVADGHEPVTSGSEFSGCRSLTTSGVAVINLFSGPVSTEMRDATRSTTSLNANVFDDK